MSKIKLGEFYRIYDRKLGVMYGTVYEINPTSIRVATTRKTTAHLQKKDIVYAIGLNGRVKI